MAKNLALDDFTFNIASLQQYKTGADNSAKIGRMKRFIAKAMECELTEKQKYYLTGYYINGKKMRELAAEKGVSEANVSKIIKRAIGRLKAMSAYLSLT